MSKTETVELAPGLSRNQGNITGQGIWSKYQGPLFVLFASLCFSTTGTAQALAPEGATPQVIGGLRLLLGFIALFLWCLFTHKMPNLKNLPKRVTVISALGVVTCQMCYFAAAKATGVAVSAVVACGFIPVATGVVAFIFIKERPKVVWYAATIIAVTGLALLSLSPDMQAKPLGLLLACTASVGYAFYSVFAKKIVANNDPATVVMVLFAIGGTLAIPLFIIYPTDWIFTTRGMLVALHLGLVATALGYGTFMAGLKTTPASTCATINLSEAIMAACWGIFLLGEQLGALHWTGMAMIFGAVTLLTLKSK